MYAEKAVVQVLGDLKVQTRFYPNPRSNSTIILVNGSLATSASFHQALRFLQPLFNVVLFDQPYSGTSRPHNPFLRMLGKEDEALILLDLIEYFRADQVMSFSWGAVSTLLALAQRPARIKRAVISSFSPVLNRPMMDYLVRGQECLAAGDRHKIATLVNDTIGKHLPPKFKRCNFRPDGWLSGYPLIEYRPTFRGPDAEAAFCGNGVDRGGFLPAPSRSRALPRTLPIDQ